MPTDTDSTLAAPLTSARGAVDQRVATLTSLAVADALPDLPDPGEPVGDVRALVLGRLLRAGFGHRFPSPTMLARIEAEIATVEEAMVYARLLAAAIDAERYPSPWMLDRLRDVGRTITISQYVHAVTD